MFGRSCPVEPCLVSDVRRVRRRRVSRNLVGEPDGSDSGPKVMFDEVFDEVMHDKREYSYFERLYSR